MTQPAVESISNTWRELWLPALVTFLLLLFELVALFNGSWWNISSTTGTDPIATLAEHLQDVRQKTGGSLIWNSVGDHQRLFTGDAIATMPQSSATLQFDEGTQLVIEPESLVILEQLPHYTPTAGKPRPIVARLVRGSIRRVGKSKTPLFVQSEPALELEPLEEGSIFKVSQRSNGFEVIVESGALLVNRSFHLAKGDRAQVRGGTTKPDLLLPAPVLKTPTIHIRKMSPGDRSQNFHFLDRVFALSSVWISSAEAAESPDATIIAVDFAWEANTKAKSYRLQISWDPDFSEAFLDEQTDQTTFTYKTAAPKVEKKMYFRVAAIDVNDRQGLFSQVAEVTIRPEVEATDFAYTEDTKTPVITKSRPKAVTAAQNSTSDVTLDKPKNTWVSVAAGLEYQRRTFRDTNGAATTTGSGFVPAHFEAAATKLTPRSNSMLTGFRARLRFLIERADTPLTNTRNGSLNSSLTELSLEWLNALGDQRWIFGFGPALGSTLRNITYSSNGAVGYNNPICGLTFSLARNPTQAAANLFYTRLTGYAVGAIGADLAAGFRFPFPRGPFLNIESNARIMDTEFSIGGLLALGYEF